jgi:hypothetical protein
LELEIREISNTNDPESRSEFIETFKEKAQEEIQELSKKMETNGWEKIIRGHCMSLVASGAGLGISIASGASPAVVSGLGLAGSLKSLSMGK